MIPLVIFLSAAIAFLLRWIVLLRRTIKNKNVAITMLEAKLQFDKNKTDGGTSK